MSDPKKILVALDFSPPSDAALAKAFELGAKFDAKVHLLHVFTLQDKSESDVLSEHDLRAAERRQLDVIARARRASGQLGEVLWQEGDPASEIVNAARFNHIDLVVIGRSGRTGWTRLRLGSVAESVARDVPCDLLIVRETSTTN